MVPGRNTNLDYSRTKAYCACSRCVGWGGGVWTFFLSSIIFLFYLLLSGRRPDIDCNTVLKAVKPPNNQILLSPPFRKKA